jgi:hypothetical protein
MFGRSAPAPRQSPSRALRRALGRPCTLKHSASKERTKSSEGETQRGHQNPIPNSERIEQIGPKFEEKVRTEDECGEPKEKRIKRK